LDVSELIGDYRCPTPMAEGFERIETDSVVDLQLSVADSLELGAAAEDRASD